MSPYNVPGKAGWLVYYYIATYNYIYAMHYKRFPNNWASALLGGLLQTDFGTPATLILYDTNF